MKREARLAQLVATISISMLVVSVVLWLLDQSVEHTFATGFDTLSWNLFFTLTLAPLGAVIATRRPGNIIGWLMLMASLASSYPINFIYPFIEPITLTPLFFLATWIGGWSWIPQIFAIFLIPLYFPTGRLPSPRWKWLPRLALGLWLFFAISTLFVKEWGAEESWGSLTNPIGFIPVSSYDNTFMVPWFIGLISLLGGSVVSLLMRYRHAGTVERLQIKWLLFAGAQFVVVYTLSFFEGTFGSGKSIIDYLFIPSIMAIPAAIAIAILRYQLYDINVIIRKTILYGVLTGLLVTVYFGGVVILQTLFEAISGQQSPIAVVISTLLIAALFNPLRRRLQSGIDRRFFRSKYDAQRVLSQFAQTARSEVGLNSLANELARVTNETVQPTSVSIWLKQ